MMKPKSNVWMYVVVLMCVLVVILILGVWYFQGLSSREEKGTVPLTTEFYKGNFSVSDAPILNRTVELVFTLETIDDAPNTTIKMFLPEGIELVEGNLLWNGDIKKDEKIEHKISIKVVKEGEWRIRAWVENEKFSGFNRAFFCYIDSEVSTGEKALSSMKTQESTGQKVRKNEGKKTTQNRDKTYNMMSPGSAIIYGYIDYEDDAGHKHPVRYATAELWKDIPWWPDEKLATSHTNSDGKFEFNIDISGEINVYVKIFCEASAVKGTNDLGGVYYGRIPSEGSKTISEGSNYMGSWYFSNEYEIWQAYDYVIDEYQWIDTRTSWTRSQITVKWPSGHCKLPDGTPWPCSDGNTIYLPRKSDMQPYSPWQRPTVLHEYGHCVMYAIYGYFPNGCGPSPHYVNSESCEGFAVTEGWAEFLQCAVDNNPDNLADYTCGRYTNIEDNNWELGRDCVADNSGAIVEGAVASIWWDIFDSNDALDPDYDELSLDFDEIFYIIRNHKPNSINKFWDYWFQHYGYKTEMNAIYWSHEIDKNNPPSCTITSPNGGGWYSGTITVSASASDTDGSVSQVEFQYSRDGSSWHNIGTDTSSSGGWSVSWDTTTIEYDSTVWVRARAKDNLGEYSSWDNSDSSFGIDNRGADLTVISVNAPTSAEVGEDITVSYAFSNNGPADSGSFYSRISLATTPYGTDIELGTFPEDSVPGGSCTLGESHEVQIPPDVTPGYYYVTVFADVFDDVAEFDENNNINKAPNQICTNGKWGDDPSNPCKERRLICSGTYEYRNKPDGTVCGCTTNNTLKVCYDGTCTDTGTCNLTYCDADVACDGKKPGEDCGTDSKCNSTCKCVKIINYGVDLTADVSEKTTTPDVNATYTLIVKNTGTSVDNYTLSVDNLNTAAIASLNRYSVTNLASGSSATVLLNVTDETEGTYNVSITATSQGNTSVSDTIITKTTVKAEYGVNLSCANPEKSIPPRGYALYDIIVKNTGNVEDTIDLILPPPCYCGWVYTLDKSSVELLPGESTVVVLNVSDVIGHPDGSYREVEVIGTSIGDPTKTDFVITNTTIKGGGFDTGKPVDPYPSIFGTHKGTIKPNKTIIAEKLYTYPCEGTGGHTEYALICNSTWCAEAKWEGYKGDWKNITFNTTVALMPYEIYDFTIITGSYPQIHHRKTLPTENGWINCTSFVDANGKVYYDRIPAIRLG